MEKLADHGNGNFAYIDTINEAKKVLITEMGGTLLTIAKDVKIQVEFNPARVQAHRLIGYENRMLRTQDFNDDKKDAGELGAGHTVTALYEIVPVGMESDVEIAGVDSLRYQTPSRLSTTAPSSELLFVKLRYKQPTGTRSILLQHAVEDEVTMQSTDFTFATAVAGFGMLLQDSQYMNGMSLDAVIELARESLGEDREGYRAEFLRLARRVQEMNMLEVVTP